MDKRWLIGITHLVRPPFEPELEAFEGRAEIVHFFSRDEADFDSIELRRLDAFLVWTPAITRRTIAELSKCTILVRYGGGYDKIDILTLVEAGIAFCNNPEYGPEDVADTTMAMLLGLHRRIHEQDGKARAYRASWQENTLSPSLSSQDCTVGVVGVGRIGISVVNRLKPFGFNVVGYDPYVPTSHERAIGYERVHDLETLLSCSDIVTLHCPLSSERRGMIGKKTIPLMKRGCILINTARGGLIESLDLVDDALRRGQLAATGFDVLPDEPPTDHPLVDAWRVRESWLDGRLIITPHNAFYSERSWYDCRYKAAETARLYLEQNTLRNQIRV